MFNSIKSTRKGFTLIELLVVIAIIGILSSVVLASLATARQKARDATRISDIKNIQLALELYYDGKQQYPAQVGATDIAASTLFTNTGWTTNPFVPTYIPKFPTDPSPTDTDFAYAYVGVTNNALCSGALSSNEPVGCASYLLGASLERSDNLVFVSDADVSVSPFTGSDAGTCIDVTNTTRRCYDLRP